MNNLSDIRPKTVKLKLDKERSLRYNLNALASSRNGMGIFKKRLSRHKTARSLSSVPCFGLDWCTRTRILLKSKLVKW